jgi:hypothetical protein
VQSCWTGREDALARTAAPELDDFQFLLPRIAARQVTPATVWASVGTFGGARDDSDAGRHENRQQSTRKLQAVCITDFEMLIARGARRLAVVYFSVLGRRASPRW